MADIQNEENKPGNLLYQKKNPGIFYITRLLEMTNKTKSLFVWLVADGWCWFVLREKYCWLVAGG
jgi:hypothetical protein